MGRGSSFVKDTIAPIVTCPDKLFIQENNPVPETYKNYGDFEAAGGSCIDNCSLNFESFCFDSETITTSGIYKTIRRNYAIEDSCGNEAVCTQKISVENPTFTSYSKENRTFETTIFPNPSKGRFTCRIHSEPTDEISLKLINSEGRILETRKVKTEKNEHLEEFEILHSGKGIYHLIISSQDINNTEKIIVQ